MHEIVLCADEESLRNPSMLGLEGESLEDQRWLLPVSGASEARGYLRDREGVDEVWVASSDDVDPINLAAALKRDCREVKVCLVAWQGSGSLLSRASSAGIDEVMGYPEMARRYAARKDGFVRDNPRRRTPERALRERAALAERANDEASRILDPPDDFAGEEASRRFSSGRFGARVVDDGPDRDPVREDFADRGSVDGRDAGKPEAAPRTKRGYAMSVVSASGGTGKSTVAVLSALIAATHGYRTVLIDGDLQFGDVATMLGDVTAVSVDKAIADPSVLDTAVLQPGVPLVLSAPERLEQSELYLPQVPGLVDRARESFDVVVVNTGSFWTESHVQIMEASTNTLFLMDQRPTSVRAVRKALDLCARCGVAANPFLFAVNRCTRKPLLTSIDISCALNGASVAELKEGGQAVAELMSAGMAQKLIDDHNDLCASLNDFLGGVIPPALGGVVPEPEALVDSHGKSKSKSKRKAFKKRGKAACL